MPADGSELSRELNASDRKHTILLLVGYIFCYILLWNIKKSLKLGVFCLQSPNIGRQVIAYLLLEWLSGCFIFLFASNQRRRLKNQHFHQNRLQNKMCLFKCHTCFLTFVSFSFPFSPTQRCYLLPLSAVCFIKTYRKTPHLKKNKKHFDLLFCFHNNKWATCG